MARRLALLATQTHESPWTRASGDESAVKVDGLGDGEQVWMKVRTREGEDLNLTFPEGVTHLLAHDVGQWLKYQVGKFAAGGGLQLTCVEVYLGSH